MHNVDYILHRNLAPLKDAARRYLDSQQSGQRELRGVWQGVEGLAARVAHYRLKLARSIHKDTVLVAHPVAQECITDLNTEQQTARLLRLLPLQPMAQIRKTSSDQREGHGKNLLQRTLRTLV